MIAPGSSAAQLAAARTRLSRADRMAQTLSVAHDLFAQRGYAALTMDELAAAVGVTKPLLYNYFGNKERLYIACMEQAGEALFAMIAGAVADAEGPAEALSAGLHAFFEFLQRDRAAWTVLFDETSAHVGAVAQRVADYRGRIVELVAGSLLARLPERRRAQARVEVEALSAALLGAAEALARWWLGSGAISASQAAELLIATVEPGLRARSAAGGGAARGAEDDLNGGGAALRAAGGSSKAGAAAARAGRPPAMKVARASGKTRNRGPRGDRSC